MIPIKDIKIKSSGVINSATLLKEDSSIKGIKAIKRNSSIYVVEEWLPLFTINRTLSQTNKIIIELHDYNDHLKKVYIDFGNGTNYEEVTSSTPITVGYTNGVYTINIKGDLSNIKRIGGEYLPISFYWNATISNMSALESIYVYNSSATTHNTINFGDFAQLKSIYLRKTLLDESKNLISGINSQVNLTELYLSGYINQVYINNGTEYKQYVNKALSSSSLTDVTLGACNIKADITNSILSTNVALFTAQQNPELVGDIRTITSNSNLSLVRLQINESGITGSWDNTIQYPLFEWYVPGEKEAFELSILRDNGVVRLRSFYMFYKNDNIVGDIAIFGDVPFTVGNPYRFRQFALNSSGITGSLTELIAKPYAPLYERHIFKVPNVTGKWSDHNYMFNTPKLTWLEIESDYLTGNIEDMSTLSSCTVAALIDKNLGGTFTINGLAVRGNFGAVINYVQAKWRWYSFKNTSLSVQNVTDSINTLFENRNLLKTTYIKEVDYSTSANETVTNGVFQQPSGFSHDLDEGNLTTLATSWSTAEKIWVLENMQVSPTNTAKRYNWLFIYDGK